MERVVEQILISVEAHLRSQSALFLNSCGSLGPIAGRADLLAVDFNNRTVWLCAAGPQAMGRLRQWQANWAMVQMSLWHESKIPFGFEILDLQNLILGPRSVGALLQRRSISVRYCTSVILT